METQSQFKVTILGSSAALPAYGRFPSSQLIEIQNRYFLVDCGEGTQMQLMRYQLPYHRIQHILISHLHGDHYLGLLGLLFSMHLQRRAADLELYGPRGLDEIITLQLKHSHSALNFKINFHIVDPDTKTILFEDHAVSIETIPLVHKIGCTGFLFKEKQKPRKIDKTKLQEGMLIQHIVHLKSGKDIFDDSGNLLYRNEDFTEAPKHSYSYAYCSDTAYHPALIEQIKNIDCLYHEATFLEDEKAKAIETKHSTAAEAASIAKQAGVKTLIIGHFSARYRELEPVLQEAQSVFSNTLLAIEGKTFEIDR